MNSQLIFRLKITKFEFSKIIRHQVFKYANLMFIKILSNNLQTLSYKLGN